MAVQPHPHRSTWTDERLDDLAATVRDGFARNDAEHRSMRQEMRDGFDRIDARFDRMDGRFDRMDDRFDAIQTSLAGRIDRLQLTIIAGLVAIIAAMIGNGLGWF